MYQENIKPNNKKSLKEQKKKQFTLLVNKITFIKKQIKQQQSIISNHNYQQSVSFIDTQTAQILSFQFKFIARNNFFCSKSKFFNKFFDYAGHKNNKIKCLLQQKKQQNQEFLINFVLQSLSFSLQLIIKQIKGSQTMTTIENLSENVIKFIQNVFIPILPSSNTSQSNALQLWDSFKLILKDIKNKQATVLDDFMDSVIASKDKCLNSMKDLQNRPRRYISTITKKPSINEGKTQSTFVRAYDDFQSMKNIPSSSFETPKRYGQSTNSTNLYSTRKQDQQKYENNFNRIIASFTNIYNGFLSNHQQLTKDSASYTLSSKS